MIRELGSHDADVRTRALDELKGRPDILKELPPLDSPHLSNRQRDLLTEVIVHHWNRRIDEQLRGTTLKFATTTLPAVDFLWQWKALTGTTIGGLADEGTISLPADSSSFWEVITAVCQESDQHVARCTRNEIELGAGIQRPQAVSGAVLVFVQSTRQRRAARDQLLPTVGLQVMIEPNVWVFDESHPTASFVVTPSGQPATTKNERIAAFTSGAAPARSELSLNQFPIDVNLLQQPTEAKSVDIKGEVTLGLPLHVARFDIPLGRRIDATASAEAGVRLIAVNLEKGWDVEIQLQRLIDVPSADTFELNDWGSRFELEYSGGAKRSLRVDGELALPLHFGKKPVPLVLHFPLVPEETPVQLRALVPLGLAKRTIPFELKDVSLNPE